MQYFDRDAFAQLLKLNRVKPRLVRDLRFNPVPSEDWDLYELLPIKTRSENDGLLLIESHSLYVAPYEITIGITNKSTGRSKPVTCDFCLTWQQGSKAARITFARPTDDHRLTYLCCADLACSLHVRSLTPDSTLSRTQLREDVTPEQRVARLQRRLEQLVAKLNLEPAQLP